MADSLVTQVSQGDDANIELNAAAIRNRDVRLEETKQAPKTSFLSRLWRCCTCQCFCSPTVEDEKPSAPDQQANTNANGTPALLGPLLNKDKGKKTLVLDLDETLVHSSFKPVPNADFVMAIELEGEIHHVYVRKRPGVDEFLRRVGEQFEVVLFTASLSKYADPLLDKLDIHNVIRARLFREACVQHYGNYVKDLSQLGRDLASTIIIDNSPYSYIFQPDNAVPISSWFNDQNDRQLLELLPFLEEIIHVDDVCTVLQKRDGFHYPS